MNLPGEKLINFEQLIMPCSLRDCSEQGNVLCLYCRKLFCHFHFKDRHPRQTDHKYIQAKNLK